MKIIGQTNGGVITEMTSDELARIMGYYSDYSAKEKLGGDWRSPGKEYKTDERYEQLQALANLPKQIKALSSAIKDAQTGIDKSVALMEKSDITKIKDK